MAVQSGDVLRVIAKMSWGENDIQNVYHMQVSGTNFGTNANVLSEISDFLDGAYLTFDQGVTDLITYDTIEAYNLTQEEYVGEQAWPTLSVGGLADDPLPPQTCNLVLFGTNTLKSQGRKFLPTVTYSQLDTDGTVSSSWVTIIGNFAAYILLGVDAGDWTAVCGNYRPLTEVFIEWIESTVRDIWATQRRRYFGRGA